MSLQQTILGQFFPSYSIYRKSAKNSRLTTQSHSPDPTVAACPPNYDNGPPVPWAGDAEWGYIGCYTEATNSRALTGASYVDTTNMTGESCAAFCAGYTYAGVEYSEEVRNSLATYMMTCEKRVRLMLHSAIAEMVCISSVIYKYGD
jgi:hypothetical protein